ncbi:hypothetical protein HN858_03655 [Candidatus Falkowbacteria bacterium]|nr:hypothetical protein [Candidatus Falkowbacteria bacterium]MBT5503694.1 hypothetical protein [Candidatus Falkowbacteria bacterium]MBT6573826.1 hypothetical protein [Candidatus Falkowbacteria bacterium]MBT7348746.1 hypothetical protein [Candidatus Falkowbacteria bacterium]MBT7500536.1 hypothetical protein [Candidatus Falkowbacteria bacterium]
MKGTKKLCCMIALAMLSLLLMGGGGPDYNGCDCDWDSDSSSYEASEPDPCQIAKRAAFEKGQKAGRNQAESVAEKNRMELHQEIDLKQATIDKLKAEMKAIQEVAKIEAEQKPEDLQTQLIKIITVKKGYWVKKHVDEVEGSDIRATYICNSWEWGKANPTVFPGDKLKVCKFSE